VELRKITMLKLQNLAVTFFYKSGASVARLLPKQLAACVPTLAAALLPSILPAKRKMVTRHMRRVMGAQVSEQKIKKSVGQAFGSYARYWIESFRLPKETGAKLEAGIDVPDYRHVREGLEKGKGVILALPHLGGWEWAVVVEPLEPQKLFDWFVKFRSELGMNVIPLGPSAGALVAAALKRNEIVCLLSDRDISGGGIKVEFLGEETTLPGGPALLSIRTGAAVLPTAVYFQPNGKHLGIVRPPLDTSRLGKVSADVSRITADLAQELGHLISRAPDQWHLMQPNWPTDHQPVDKD
jgi:lauroyl/myristoyl acyltransferase